MAFENIEEIVLRLRAEGMGEADKVKQAMAEIRAHVDGLLGSLAEGGDANSISKIFRDVGAANRQLGEMEKYLAAIGQSEVAAAKEAARARAEIEKQEKIEREINLKQKAAEIRAAAKEEAQAAREESRARTDAEKEERSRQAAELRELNAQRKAAAKERADAEKEIQREREHNLREEAKAKAAAQKQYHADLKSNMDAEVEIFRRNKAEEVANEKRAADEKARIQAANLERLKAALADRTRAEKEVQVELERNLNQENDRLERQRRAMEQGRGAAEKFGFGLLNVAHAVQDMQYGFGAVLNNIPLVAQALGAGPGLAGTVMIAGVGISVFGDHLKQLGREMGLLRDPAKDAASTVEQLKDKIAAMVEKPWKLDIDFRAIERGKQELSILEERFRALDAAIKKQTSVQQKSGAAVLEAVTEMGGEQGERGGTENLTKIVREVADKTGLTDIFMSNDSRQRQLAQLRGRANAKPAFGASGAESLLTMANADQARRQAESLEAQIREDARQSAVGATVGSALRGGDQGIADLLMMLQSPEGRKLMQGDRAKGILPVDPRMIGRLREARPAGINAQEEFEQEAAVIDTELNESIEAMKRQRKARKAAADQEVSSLVSRKAKPLESDLTPDILKRIRAGDTRQDIAVELNDEVLRRMGDVPHAKEAAEKIARQLMETVFSDVMAAKGPGIDDRQAAGNLLRENAAAAATKSAKVLKDPVTGQPLSEAQKEELEQIDKQIKAGMRERERAGTPQGMQRAFRGRQLAQMQGLASEIGTANPGLNPQQVLHAAQTANNLMGQNVNRDAAINEAIFRLNVEMMQNMQLLQARQQGFMGTFGQLRQQNRRMMQPGTSLLPSPWPNFGNGR